MQITSGVSLNFGARIVGAFPFLGQAKTPQWATLSLLERAKGELDPIEFEVSSALRGDTCDLAKSVDLKKMLGGHPQERFLVAKTNNGALVGVSALWPNTALGRYVKAEHMGYLYVLPNFRRQAGCAGVGQGLFLASVCPTVIAQKDLTLNANADAIPFYQALLQRKFVYSSARGPMDKIKTLWFMSGYRQLGAAITRWVQGPLNAVMKTETEHFLPMLPSAAKKVLQA